MRRSSLYKASLSATDFPLSPKPSNNKALADENATLRAKLAELRDEKEKWKIKCFNLNLKVSAHTKYEEDVKKLLQRMWIYLQSLFVVGDMLDNMLKQEADYEEIEHHNTKSKQRTEPEQPSKNQHTRLMIEEEQHQQYQLPQHQLQNNTVNPVQQLSQKHNQTRKSMTKNGGEHNLHHPKYNTGFHLKEVHDQLADFGHVSYHNNTSSVSEEKHVRNGEEKEMPMNQAIQKSRLSNILEDHGICLNVSSGNDGLKHSSSFPKENKRKEQHEQTLERNELLKCSSHEYECKIFESEQHLQDHLTQVQNAPSDNNLSLKLQQDQSLQMQQTASQKCYPLKYDSILKASQLYNENESQQPFIKDQHPPLSNQCYQEKDRKAGKLGTIHVTEMEQQILKQQETGFKCNPTLELDSGTQYCERAHEQNAGLQGQLQTEHEHFNTPIQKQKFFTPQRLSVTGVQGLITTDQVRELAVNQDMKVAFKQGMNITGGKDLPLRNRQDKQMFTEHIGVTKSPTHTMEHRNNLTVNNERYLSTVSSPKSKTITELQVTYNVDLPVTCDTEQLLPIENRWQGNNPKSLQSVEKEKRNSLKSKEHLPTGNDNLYSIKRDQRSNTGKREPLVGIQQLPVKLHLLFPAKMHNVLPFGDGHKLFWDKENQKSLECDQQHSPSSVLQQQKQDECGEQHSIKQDSVKDHNVKVQQLTSFEAQQQEKLPPFGCRQQLPVKLNHLFCEKMHTVLPFREDQKLYWDEGKQQSLGSDQHLSPAPVIQRQIQFECGEQQSVKQHNERKGIEHNVKGQQLTSIEVQQQKNSAAFGSTRDPQQPTVEKRQQLNTVQSFHLPNYQLSGEGIQQSTLEIDSCLTPEQIQQTVLGKEQSHSTGQNEQLIIKRGKLLTIHGAHKLKTGREIETTDNQGVSISTSQKDQFVSGQQQCHASNILQYCVENEINKLVDRQCNQVTSDEGLKLEAKNRNQFDKEVGLDINKEQDKEVGLYINKEQRIQFAGEHAQKISSKEQSQLVTTSEQRRLSPLVEQGHYFITEQGQQEVVKYQQLEDEQCKPSKGKETRLSLVKEIEGLAASTCWSAPENCQQPGVEQALQELLGRFQSSFTKQSPGLSADHSKKILVHKTTDTITKEIKWLPAEQCQQFLTEEECNPKRVQGQSTTTHCEKELLEHSSVFLLSELSKTGFETSCNSSTQSILRYAKKIQQISKMKNTVLHTSYMEDSIIKKIPVITEAHNSKALELYEVSHATSPGKWSSRNERPRRKCTIGVNYVISP